MKAVLKYPGAKWKIAKWIVENIPEHHIYVEPYFGSGAIFFNKAPCYNEILNDLDDDVYIFFKVLRENGEELVRQINATPYSRTEYEKAYKTSGDVDDLEKARVFAVKCCQGFGAGNRYKNGFRRGIGATSPNPAKAWKELPESLLLAMERIKNAQIEKKDAIELIKSLKGKNTFIYVDPPYMQGLRKGYLYNKEMSNFEHVELLKALCESSCKIMLSGYDSEIYNRTLKGWIRLEKSTTAECSVRRLEVIWMNYDINKQLCLLKRRGEE